MRLKGNKAAESRQPWAEAQTQERKANEAWISFLCLFLEEFHRHDPFAWCPGDWGRQANPFAGLREATCHVSSSYVTVTIRGHNESRLG